jgi:hypothetical protein
MPVELEKIVHEKSWIRGEKPKRKSVVDELLGAFEGAVPESETSTECIKKLREMCACLSLLLRE